MSSTQFLNAEEVARYLNVGKNTVYELAKAGKLACYRLGRKMRFTVEDADAYLASTWGTVSPGADASAAAPVASAAPASGVDHADEDTAELVAAASFDAPTGPSFVIAGADRAADVLMGALCNVGIPATRLVRGAYTALVNLYAGEAHAAVIDLYDQASNSWNVPYVRNLAPGAAVVVFRLISRPAGIIVAAGNPKRLRSWGALLHEDVRLVNRTKGSGARVLLDEKFRAMDVRTEAIAGYAGKTFTGAEAAQRVAQGMADVTIGNPGDAAGVAGTEFVPLQTAWVDLVVRKAPETRPVIRRLKDLLASDALRGQFAAGAEDDASRAGIIIYES
ncbi:MAG: helix-turn-helix transcriptional regulator [Eggerthellaceae bacterium]|nr:helix-turn-helix transcriptional regulator [Eggerthellaceae bacterium]